MQWPLTNMTDEQAQFLASILKWYFPELGTDEPLDGADCVDELNELYSALPQVDTDQG